MTDVKGKDDFLKMPQVGSVDIVPSGGTAGYVLTKDTATDYDYSWQEASGGGGAIQVVETSIGQGTTSSTHSVDSTPTITSGAEIASLNITPNDTANRVQVSWSFLCDEASDAAYYIFIFRGSTLIHVSTGAGVKRGFYGISNGVFLDNPATTSQITYSIRVCCSTGASYWGRDKNGKDLNGSATTGAYFKALEISIG